MNTIFKIPGLKSLAASGLFCCVFLCFFFFLFFLFLLTLFSFPFPGMLLGGGVAFLTLNERRGVAAEKLRLLAEFQATSLIETDVENVDPSLDGKLLHYQGMLRPDIPPADHMFGVSGKELLAIRRTVEMYQWKEHKVVTKNKDTKEETTKYTYSKVWSPFHLQTEGDIDKKNPMFPSDLEGGIRLFLGNGIHLGTSDKLVLSQELLDQMTDYKPLALSREFLRQDGEPFPHNLQLNRTRSGLSSGKGLLSDNIGDLRVTFEGVYTGPYSALAKLSYATDKTRHLTPWVASLKQSLASEGPVEMPKNLDDLLGYSLDSFVIPEPVIAWLMIYSGFGFILFKSLFFLSGPRRCCCRLLLCILRISHPAEKA